MRTYNRFATDQDVICKVDGEDFTVGLYNLSCGGCMIETPSEAAVEGQELQVTLNPKITVPGKIVWRINKNAGIKFDIPLHQKVVEHFGYEDELFDRDDPRDRFGIPLVEIRAQAAGAFD